MKYQKGKTFENLSRELNIPISTLYHVRKNWYQISEKYAYMNKNSVEIMKEKTEYRRFIYETLKPQPN